MKLILSALLLTTGASASAQVVTVPGPPVISGTRLDIVATGEVTRVPDIARINAGVITTAPTAGAALSANGAKMTRVLAALKRAGVADRDVQTSAVNLQANYRYAENQPPILVGYQASNQVTVRFRDIATSGTILDTLVREGANQINGPSLEIDRPEAALDEARVKAIAAARARADLYARAAGLRVVRILSISEAGGYNVPQPPPIYARAAVEQDASTKIAPGEQALQVSVSVSFELR